MIVRLVSLSLMLMLLGLGCAQKVDFEAMPVVPASDVDAKVTRDANDNARVRLDIKHLAPPERLSPPKSMYIVWAQTPTGRNVNLGRLRVKKNRSARFETVTPLEKFRLLITAEDAADVATPSQQIVLGTEVFHVRKKGLRKLLPLGR